MEITRQHTILICVYLRSSASRFFRKETTHVAPHHH
jgi:hypothetical protein